MENRTEMGAYTLAPDITTEQMHAVFFDANALHEPNYRLCQLNARGRRYYYLLGDKEGKLFPSVTTILKQVMPENRFLTEWKMALGKEESEAYTMDRARFGTFVHGQLQELLITRKYDLDSLRDNLARYVEREKLPISFMEHEDEAKCAMLSFALWMQEYDVRPVAVEISLYHPEYNFAGMLDCVCDMRKFPISDEKAAIAKAEGDEKKLAKIEEKYSKRVHAIIDFKSTTKDFRDEHIVQLGLYRMMWDSTFTDFPIDEIGNVSPKAWWNTAGKKVSFQFDWQTDQEILAQIPYLLGIYQTLPKEEKKIVIPTGLIDLSGDISSCAKVCALEDLVAEQESDPFEKLCQDE